MLQNECFITETSLQVNCPPTPKKHSEINLWKSKMHLNAYNQIKKYRNVEYKDAMYSLALNFQACQKCPLCYSKLKSPPFATVCISVNKSTATFTVFTLFFVVFVVCLCPKDNWIIFRRKMSASIDGGLSGGSSMRRPGSEEPHRR